MRAQVALKFFLNNGRFLRDEALFQQSALRPLMQAVLSMHSNAQGAITYGPYAFPPCIIMSRGESLKAWIRSETRSFHQVRSAGPMQLTIYPYFWDIAALS